MDNEIMKRRKFSISSEDSDTIDSHITLWSRGSKSATTKHPWTRQEEKKPSEVFRTDLITAMKLPESYQLNADEYYVLADSWRQEWEKGVQVPANTESIPEPVVRVSPEFEKTLLTPREQMLESLTSYESSESAHMDMKFSPRSMCRYDLDEVDVHWLELVNAEFQEAGMLEVDELMMEKIIEELESQCQENMNLAIETEEGLGIEYDEDVVCDVCRSPEGEDGNEMVFCDKCNICVHQACYGILKVPLGSWLCRTCALGVQPKCLLCPKRGGALKPTRSGTKWVHVSCALWIPEVSIGCPEKMEPITKVSHIPASRWALACSLCTERTGTCIQCSMASCITAFHVTCAFDRNLEMRTILAENDEVKFKSYCLEHSSTPTTCSTKRDEARQFTVATDGIAEVNQSERDLEKASLRKQKLQQLEEEFYELVKPTDVAQQLQMSDVLVDFFYQYWRLKRKSNFNKPLLAPKTDEVDNLAQQEQDILYRRLRLFTHLRQDLERVRNLCYMVTRREKMKRSVSRLQEQIFHHQTKLIEENLHRGYSGKKIKGKLSDPKERGKNRSKGSHEKKGKLTSETQSLLKQFGLSTSISLDGDLLQNWLAQTVQAKTENLLSHWSFHSGPGNEEATSYLSDKLMHDEQSLLSIGSMNSAGDPQSQPSFTLEKESRHKAGEDSKSKSLKDQVGIIHTKNQCKKQLDYPLDGTSWPANSSELAAQGICTNGPKGLGAKANGSHKRASEVRKISKKQASHHSSSKAALPSTLPIRNTSEIGETLDYFESALPKPSSSVKVPKTSTNPKSWVTFKIPKPRESSRKSQVQKQDLGNSFQQASPEREKKPKETTKVKLLFDNETDGYFSDAEMSDSDTESMADRSQRLQRLSSESMVVHRKCGGEVVRRSILAS
ncbi:protein Jade-1 [Pristis pectinata]|uniref:protein Jade-1 n=1 Tax=Pristis pectinata TaxID=685728 RepID=UPI00223E455A|nr:protein Jade-1 [Pristis pectinata]XP_051869661.1 protein Jade-1 [Pristis pectinata]XP_051869662.1 protein Jade-1 [Pristis pectinata]XP_051869663.1 protein Jade-1 [Pristis pectinata]XP_051869664.1 protein Jade-1 [Pristis pectinata]